MKINTYESDLPANIEFKGSIAIDTEAMGLNFLRDRLCLVQIADHEGAIHIVKFSAKSYSAPNLKRVLEDTNILKIFHYARFDIMMLNYYLSTSIQNVYCTKIASFLARTYTPRHGLKDLCQELIGVDLSKQQQSSDWGTEILSNHQLKYAASDVIYLHALKDKLNIMLEREGRLDIAQECFKFLKTRVDLDLLGMAEDDIFGHKLRKV